MVDLFIESGHVEKSDFAEEKKTTICYRPRKIVNRPSLARYLDSPTLRSLKLYYYSSPRFGFETSASQRARRPRSSTIDLIVSIVARFVETVDDR